MAQVTSILISEIHCDEEFNCRGHIDPTSVVELAKDIEEKGLIQPIIVAPYSPKERQRLGFNYRAIAGYRRLLAHRVLKKERIDCIIRDDMMSDAEARFFNLCENIQRQDLSILQESKAIQGLIALGIRRDEIAAKIGKSVGWVQVRMYLLELPSDVQLEVERSGIVQTDIRKLYTIFKAAGRTGLEAAVRTAKDAKLNNRKANLDKHIDKQITQKKQRTKEEIFAMQDHIRTVLGNGFGTTALAWAAGEVSDLELYNALKAVAEAVGRPYQIPKEGYKV